MNRSCRAVVGALVFMFAASCDDSKGSGPSTERTGGVGGTRSGTGGSSNTAGRGGGPGGGGTAGTGGGAGAPSGSGSGGSGANDGGMSDGARGTDAGGGTGGAGGSGGAGGMSDGGKSDGGRSDMMSDGARGADARGGTGGMGGTGGSGGTGGRTDGGKSDGMVMRDSGTPDKPTDARTVRDSAGPPPMRDAAPTRDAAGPSQPPSGDFCPQAIRHSAEHPPGGVGVGQGIDCDNINVGRVACNQAGTQRFECVYNAGPNNPNNFGKHWEACGSRRCQTCRLTIVTERPPPYFNPFAAATCN